MKFGKESHSPEHKIHISFKDQGEDSTSKEIMKILQNGLYINYDEEDLDKLESQGIIHGGQQSYFISPISSQNKFSTRYINCQGIVASGISTKTGELQSFFTHQDTCLLLNNKQIRDDFSREIFDKIKELKNNSEPGSVDVVMFGGNGFFKNKSLNRSKNNNKLYLNGAKIISNIVKETLGTYPIIAHSPKQSGGRNDVYFDNNENKLYIIDTGDIFDYSHRPFTWENISKMKALWESQAYQK